MSFRFTPGCCCASDECVPPCIPDCEEIYRGAYEPTRTFTIIDKWSGHNYNNLSGCSYFTLRELSGSGGEKIYEAVPTTERSDDNHILAHIVSATFTAYSTVYLGLDGFRVTWRSGLADYQVDYPHSGDTENYPTNPPVATLTPDTLRGYQVRAGVSYGGDGARSTSLWFASYDERWHSGEWHSDEWGFDYEEFSWRRVICLPFDTNREPIRFCDGQPVELRPVADKKDYYVSLNGSPGWSCSFPYPTTCGMGGDVSASSVFAANKLGEKIRDSVGSWLSPALDYIVVRLFGWATCPLDTTSATHYSSSGAEMIVDRGWTCPPVSPVTLRTDLAEEKIFAGECLPVSLEFKINYLQRSNRLFEAVVEGNVSTADVTIDWNAEGGVDQQSLPDEIRDFAVGAASVDRENARIVFGSADTSALAAQGSTGSADAMPNRWRITGYSQFYRDTDPSYLSSAWQHNDRSSNQTRFHGVYWSLASISRCGTDFPEYVTSGKLEDVPVAKFSLNMSSIEENEWVPGWHRAENGFRFVCGADGFSYRELHTKFYEWQGDGASNNERFARSLDTYTDGVRYAYIVKPPGKTLIRGIWRVFKRPLMIWPKNDNWSVESDEDIVTLGYPYSVALGAPTNPVNEWDATHLFNLWGRQIAFEDATPGLPIYSEMTNFGPGGRFDTNGIISNYAINHNYNLYEISVSGDHFIRLTDPDDNTVYYMPALNNDKLSALFGVNPYSMANKLKVRGGLANYRSGFGTANVYLYYDFTYLAIWGDEGGS